MRSLLSTLAVATILVIGCSEPTEKKQPGEDEPAKAAAKPVDLEVVKHEEFLEEIKKFRGKLVLIDFWGTG